MHRKLSLSLASAVMCGLAQAQFIWVPVPPVIIGPPPVVTPQTPAHRVAAGSIMSVMIPGTIQYDAYGHVVNQLQHISGFEVVMGPGSTKRGCKPALRSDGFANTTAVWSPWALAPTTRVSTYKRTMPGEAEQWTVHQFSVNGGQAAPVSQIDVFVPRTRNMNGAVECAFQVNVNPADPNGQPATGDQGGSAAAAASPQSVTPQSAVTANASNPLRVEVVPAGEGKSTKAP
jgi:hypothetical protein